ncbi:MAG: DUF1579 family protein [Chitinophagaceae bacterium]
MSKFETSKSSGAHFNLSQMTGEWEGTTRTYFDESKVPVDESPMHGTIKSILGGRFMLHEYQGLMQGKPFEGVAIYGHHLDSEKFQCAWVDSYHMGTGILFSEDKQDNKLFSVLGSYGGGDETWGWRTDIEMPDKDHLNIISTNLTPQGEPAGGVQTNYIRK